jgi:hypothetical protein
MAEFPESILARKPELRPVVQALEEFATGRPITATCYHCSRPLTVERVQATGAVYVRCPNGDTLYHQAQRSPRPPPAQPLVTAADAVGHGLPPLSVFADLQAARMALFPFPAPGMYLSASGPPGAPAAFSVWTVPQPAATAEDIARIVPEVLTHPSIGPVAIGESSRVMLDNATRPAVLFTTGTNQRMTGWVGAVLTQTAGSVLVMLGRVGSMPTSVQELLQSESLAAVAESFRLS